MKTLTICITTFNNEPFIYNLLYEIKSQVNRNQHILDEVDFIVYDDKSTECEFIKDIPDYFRLFVSDVNRTTPAVGRNHIIKNANSKFVFFIDGDDILIRDITDLLAELAGIDKDIIFSEVKKIGADGQQIKSPFIYTDELINKQTTQDVLEKICVHQTGIWSIYKVEFLQKNKIYYETNMRYEDNYFLFNILLNNPNVGVLSKPYYGWRTNYSSFSFSSDSIEQRILLYEKSLELISDNLENKYAPYILYSLWNQTYSNIIRNYPKLTNVETKEYFKLLSKVTSKYATEIKLLMSYADPNYVDSYFKIYKLRLFRGFNFINMLKLINKRKVNKNNLKKRIAKLFSLVPINDKKVFMTSHYGEFGSNPKYYYYRLKAENPELKITYFVKDTKSNPGPDFYDYNNRLLFFYHLYTSKQVYFDTWMDPTLIKRKKQIWNQMWHGYPYKKMFTDIEIYDNVNSTEKHNKKLSNIRKWNNVYSVNERNTQIFKNLFPSVTVVEQEYPRITWLIENKNNSKLKSEIRKKYNLLPNQKYTLFAPTYRPYNVYFSELEVNNLASKNHEVIYNPHPLMISNYEHHGITLSNVDIQEILLVIDELITDCSSIKYDFLKIHEKDKLIHYMPDEILYRKLNGIYDDN